MPTLVIDTSVQGGSFDRTTGVWTDEVLLQDTLNDTTERWLQFDRSSLTAINLVGGTSIQAVTLELFWFGLSEYRVLELFCMLRPPLYNFSTANPPRPTTEPFSSETVLLTNGVPNSITVPLNLSDGRANTFLAQLGMGSAHTRVAIGARWVGSVLANQTTFREPRITYDQAFTGLAGKAHARGRADECPKCGGKSTRDTWVRDGYTQMMVCPECYDEPDLVGRSYQGLGSERPGSGEG
ncbi:MAG TPA: hypothetical protein VJA25_06430 [Dehalococcoidia bacterium]|nr:hypothetical protein [Dehalococcoidia bacterium]